MAAWLCGLGAAACGDDAGAGDRAVARPGPARSLAGGEQADRVRRPPLVREQRARHQPQRGGGLQLPSRDRHAPLRAPPVQPGRRRSDDRGRPSLLALRGPARKHRLGRISGHRRARLAARRPARRADLPYPRDGRRRRAPARRHFGLVRRPSSLERRRPSLATPLRSPDAGRPGEPGSRHSRAAAAWWWARCWKAAGRASSA